MFKVALIAAMGVATVLHGAEAASFEMDATDAAFLQVEAGVEMEAAEPVTDEWLIKAEKELAALDAEKEKLDTMWTANRFYAPKGPEGQAMIAKAEANYKAALFKANTKRGEVRRYREKLEYETELKKWQESQKKPSLVEVDAAPAAAAPAAAAPAAAALSQKEKELAAAEAQVAATKAAYAAAIRASRPANSDKAKRLAVIKARRIELKAKIAARKAQLAAKKSIAKKAKSVATKVSSAAKSVGSKLKKAAGAKVKKAKNSKKPAGKTAKKSKKAVAQPAAEAK